jgi:hypothetical protein
MATSLTVADVKAQIEQDRARRIALAVLAASHEPPAWTRGNVLYSAAEDSHGLMTGHGPE